MTLANVADSEVFLDLGHSIMEMTNCHKIETNEDEIRRSLSKTSVLRIDLSVCADCTRKAQI